MQKSERDNIKRGQSAPLDSNKLGTPTFLEPRWSSCGKRKKRLDRGSNTGLLRFMKGALTTELPSQFVEESSTPTVVVARLHTTLCVTSANSVTLLRLLTQCLLIRAGPNTSAASIAYRTPRPSSYSPLHAHIRVVTHQGHTTTTIR